MTKSDVSNKTAGRRHRSAKGLRSQSSSHQPSHAFRTALNAVASMKIKKK